MLICVLAHFELTKEGMYTSETLSFLCNEDWPLHMLVSDIPWMYCCVTSLQFITLNYCRANQESQ